MAEQNADSGNSSSFKPASGKVVKKTPRFRIPLPEVYRRSAKALQGAITENKTLGNFLNPYANKYQKEAYGLASLTLVRNEELEYIFNKTQFFRRNKHLITPWVAKVLVAEMLWGHQVLKSNAKEIKLMKLHEETFRECYLEVSCIFNNPLDKDKLHLPTYIRINTLTFSIEDAIKAFSKEGWHLIPRCSSYSEHLRVVSHLHPTEYIKDYHISELFVFPPKVSFYNHPGYVKGKFLIQDKGSCLPSFLLNPKPDSVVLDLFAAPGLQTNHLANIMNNTGLIYANDLSGERRLAMMSKLELTNVTNVKPLKFDCLNLEIPNPEEIKYIIVDPHCTKSGVFYDKANKNILSNKINSSRFQLSMILRNTLQTLTNVKRVVFTTCSVYPEEGEVIVDEVLKAVGNSYTLLDVKEMLWNEWDSVSPPEYACGNKCLRIVPEYDLCHAYFIAVFERNTAVPVPPYTRKYTRGGKIITEEEYIAANKAVAERKVIREQKKASLTPAELKLIRLKKKEMRKDRFMAKKEKKKIKFLKKYNNANSNAAGPATASNAPRNNFPAPN